MSEYTPIEGYGIVGNLETCALVGRDGSIDWCCLPSLSSPSVFARLLDGDGGHFSITPVRPYDSEQRYLPRTNVLETTFYTDSGEVTVTDFMPFLGEDNPQDPSVRGLYRKVACTEGTVDLEVEIEPRFDYGRSDPMLESIRDGVLATGEDDRLVFASPIDLQVDQTSATSAFPIEAGESHWFVAQYGMQVPTDDESAESLLEQTIDYWREWAHSCDDGDDCHLEGYAHDLVVRSGLVLKLLTFRDSGAVAAAPTASLPEVIGGVRNWDYRFSWIRDGAFTTRALTNIGHTEEARNYLADFLQLSREFDPADIRPLYGLRGEEDLEEETLEHFSGYRNSMPVHIGNEASSQTQLDVYGELVLSVYQLSQIDDAVAERDWDAVYDIVEHVCEVWDEKDEGIWEMRGDPKHFVHSKVMCWTAIDRALTIADESGFDVPEDRWKAVREEIKETVIEEGFDEERNSFTQSFRNEQLDATVLMLPMSGMLPFDDERVQGTIDAIQGDLGAGDGLVFRYEEDSLPGREGTFVVCSFWLINCLALSGRMEEAWNHFEQIQQHFNSLGLISEEVDPETRSLARQLPTGVQPHRTREHGALPQGRRRGRREPE